MKLWTMFVVCFITISPASVSYGSSKELLGEASGKKRLLVVSSYHGGYTWSQETNEGLTAAMLKFGYFDNNEQAAEYTKNDYVETSKAILKKLWMDTKRKAGKGEMAKITLEITRMGRNFKPDLIFLGDDNAAKYIGNQFLDSEIPVVFWGVNNTPLKYGLVDRKDEPGHNVTGVYQSGYYVESMELLKKICPDVKTFAILSDGTASGRSHVKKMEFSSRRGDLPVKLVDTITTSDFDVWKSKALELEDKVDALFLAQYSGLKDKDGGYVSSEEVTRWFVTHIDIPEAAVQGQFVKQGMLCSADDSGYNQGYAAVVIAHDILSNGKDPASYPPIAPERGALIVNKQRAELLGITLTEDMGIEEVVESIPVLAGEKNAKK